MVKTSFLMVCSIVLAASAVAQNRANIWELSYQIGLQYPNCEMKYAGGNMDTNSIFREMAFFITDASICDTAGNLLFYSNGLSIANRLFDTLQNSVNFNPGTESDISEPDGLPITQGVLIIPIPDHPKQYAVFHESGELFYAHNQGEAQPLHLSYSVVDMDLDGGLGGIVDTLKDIYLIEDTLTQGGLMAVKHANGRDWWVILHRYYSDEYYKLLVTPDGIKGPYSQNIGKQITSDIDVQETFSPDGSKFCFTDFSDSFTYMNFDRCTGDFYNPQTIFTPDSIPVRGNSFSPNNRFLYTSTLINLYQYDTWDSNMVQNMIHIASWDTFYDWNLPVYFFMHQLAPDGKIYISPYDGVKYLNVINNPDSLGFACNFTPHSYTLPTWTVNIPTFPNYDLGPLPDSPCDTIPEIPATISNEVNSTFTFSPNPAHSYINIVYSVKENSTLTITDAYGRQVKQLTLYLYFKNRIVYVDELAAGMYFVQVQAGNRIWVEKMVKE